MNLCDLHTASHASLILSYIFDRREKEYVTEVSHKTCAAAAMIQDSSSGG